ncbi:hypothetical protein [Nocardiopsis sp. FR26]|uniref:hypothetical protein n=1 Tax=Nocardiopsis sp. FR26 TaxID=2605987 RepID=UPI001357FEF1|nr:hypothetical protein [Nocardiopsis sp. FR26]
MSSNTTTSTGVGFSGLLTLLFTGLKLTGHITWSWWWVLSPLWISALLALVFIVGALAVIAVITRD